MTQTYEQDIVAWANEQSHLLRTGCFDQLDIAHLAEEIEDVGKSEQRELANRMALLLAHLLKWQSQPEYRGASWQITIRNQRRGIARRLRQTPSLNVDLNDADWWNAVWDDAIAQAAQETGLADFPDCCPWDSCRVPWDYIPNRSYPLFQAREALRTLCDELRATKRPLRTTRSPT